MGLKKGAKKCVICGKFYQHTLIHMQENHMKENKALNT